MPSIRTLEDLEAEVGKIPLEKLVRLFHDCAAAGHVWLDLDAPALTSRRAEYCARCLRVRIGEAEFWPSGCDE